MVIGGYSNLIFHLQLFCPCQCCRNLLTHRLWVFPVLDVLGHEEHDVDHRSEECSWVGILLGIVDEHVREA